MSFHFTNRKMIFNGNDLSSYAVVEHIERTFTPSLSTTTKGIPFRHGEYFMRQTRGTKAITVHLRIIGDSVVDRWEKLQKLKMDTYSTAPKKLSLYDCPDRYEMAILDGSDGLVGLRHTGFVSLTFLCPSGTSFAERETVKNITSGTTIESDCPLPLPYIVKGRTSASTITFNDVKITGAKTGESFFFDTDSEIVRIGGVERMNLVSIDSDFGRIVQGGNTFAIKGLDSVTVTYREEYL